MSDFQDAKRIVLDFYNELDAADEKSIPDVLSKYCVEDILWRGMHPFHKIEGTAGVAETFWQPMRAAFGKWQRRPDIFFSGTNFIDGHETTWVVQMGHLLADWTKPFIGIPASMKATFFRYVEFHRIEDGRIVETASFNDMLSLINQAGFDPIDSLFGGKQPGARIITPGPRTHDGVVTEAQPAEEGQKTLEAINTMISELIGLGAESPVDHLAKYWTEDMCWFGPGSIGASTTFPGYRRGHTGPFEDGLTFIRHNGHICRSAEANVGGFFGYPSMTMINSGDYLGVPSSEVHADMRIVDLYRREGDKLAENWIFIDMLHFFNMQGVDLLAEVTQKSG